jgi:hypothetical protein
MSTAPCDLKDFLDWIFLFEVDEMFSTQAQREFPSLVSSINNDWSDAHCGRQLDTLDTNAAATTWENCPLAWSQV